MIKSEYFPFNQGEDHVTPPIHRNPGSLNFSRNYEMDVNGGLRRIDGYERYDGRSRPSEQNYWTLQFTGGTGAGFAVDDVVTGQYSTATAEIIAVTVTSGSYAGSDAVGEIVLALLSGTFTNTESLQVLAMTIAAANGIEVRNGTATDSTHTTYLQLAEEKARSKIAAVPGSGPIRGVWGYNGDLYAFRDNTAAADCDMYKATATGWTLIITPPLVPGGKFRFKSYNFGGASATYKMFGCDGKNKAFEFDGATMTQITTGMTVDTPTHITAFKKHLFLSFDASVQHSSIGDPLTWSPVLGAAELAVGDRVTGFIVLQGGSMAVFSRNSTNILRGSSSADWTMPEYSFNTGAIEHTTQRIGDAYYLDDRGVTHLQATQVYGNFASATITQKVQKWLASQASKVTDSVVVRKKNQYRIFMSDGNAITIGFVGQQTRGITRMLYPDSVECACSMENSSGEEELYFGSDNGFVYQMDKGTSFDGAAIEASLALPHYNYQSPRLRKRFRRIIMEVESTGTADISYQAEFSYGSPGVGQPGSTAFTLIGTGGRWDVDNWDEFVWTGQQAETMSASIEGTGLNMGLVIYSRSIYNKPHVLHGMTTHFTTRRQQR